MAFIAQLGVSIFCTHLRWCALRTIYWPITNCSSHLLLLNAPSLALAYSASCITSRTCFSVCSLHSHCFTVICSKTPAFSILHRKLAISFRKMQSLVWECDYTFQLGLSDDEKAGSPPNRSRNFLRFGLSSCYCTPYPLSTIFFRGVTKRKITKSSSAFSSVMNIAPEPAST